MTLVDARGNPLSSSMYKKKEPGDPLFGEIIAPWAGLERIPKTRFGLRNSLQFDTSKLTLEDYAMMRDHYQVNSSITVLTFMLHQIDWRIECDNIKIAKHCEENLRLIWTRLIRAVSQAFVYGFSPCALQWENDLSDKKTWLTKIKDLHPEDCTVHWKKVPGVASRKSSNQDGTRIISNPPIPMAAQPKPRIYDGIDVAGYPTIPASNTLWYPLLMQHGDFYGRKLLNAAWQPWFFSTLIHYYSNRYFERFGEPTLISRAPFNEKISVNGKDVQGNILMHALNKNVRAGGDITLPNDRAQNGIDGVDNYEYTMEYLESQMRGADFERYLTRLDQEISLALFTPLLMMNTGESGGSFNLGIVHMNMYDNMIAAVAGDLKEYFDKYVLRPMAKLNFGPDAELPKWTFRKPNKVKEEIVRTIILALLNNGNGDKSVKVNLDEFGQELGLSLEEIERVQEPNDMMPGQENPDGQNPKWKPDQRVRPGQKPPTGKGQDKPTSKASVKQAASKLAKAISDRISGQFIKGLREGAAELAFDIGHDRQLSEVMPEESVVAFQTEIADWAAWYYEMESENDAPLESTIKAVILGHMEERLCDA